jgi:hypothetical protein
LRCGCNQEGEDDAEMDKHPSASVSPRP